MFGTSIVAFVVVLGVLIFAHELGHFLVARLFGVGVEKFSLGFGPRLVGKTIGITDYRISAVPLGGYVKMVGEEPDADLEPEQIAVSFTHQHVFKRICIVAAGPAFNMLLAVLLFFVLFIATGVYRLEPVVGTVQEDTPAARAGIRPGDRVLAIDGEPVESWEEMASVISKSGGSPLSLRLQREGSPLEISVSPDLKKAKNLFGEEIDRYLIGISSSGEVVSQKLGFGQALSESVVQTYRITELTVVSIVKLIQGTLSAKTLGGPLMIAEMAGQQAERGMASLTFFIALISINLAILNILPIPVLDGGHLLFFFIELVRGKPVSVRVREIAQQAGMAILLFLMIFVFYNDITRIFFS
ncbi:MAG: RIP metalloprotease RseP [Desulfobacteraceae bacterium]|jgi:regulator of sigma E protease|nr:RIP metalloprotease RseP [Desulfobacteraceae bacterium]